MLKTAKAAVLVALLASPAAGDVVTLKSGGVFEGKVTESDDQVTIETPHLTLNFERSQVAGITYRPAPSEVYDSRAGKLDASDAEGWYQLGIYAAGKGLYRKAEEAFRKALEADPDHEGARGELGYVRVDGEWLTRAEAMERRGLVNYRGRWMAPEEAEDLEAQAEALTRVKEARSRVRTLTFTIVNGPREKSLEAREKLAGMSDPAALGPLVEELENDSAAVRLAILEALLNYPGEDAAALAALDVAMWDADPDIRYRARVVLNAFQNERAFKTVLAALQVDDDVTRFRASEVLGSIGDPRAVPYLIKYLYWTRPAPAPARPARTSGRRHGLSHGVQKTFVIGIRAKVARNAVGYEPVIGGLDHGRIVILNPEQYEEEFYDFPAAIDRRVLNYEALEALRALTGANFRFDKRAWRNWYLANAARFKKLPEGAPGP